ncbi:MAG: DUF58 domain-containing protein [Spirochaetes bacterium]|nr:DUF58 domain-containing protein [Spirochaetota bacterium]
MYPWNKAGVADNPSTIQSHVPTKVRPFLQPFLFRIPLTLQGTLTLTLSFYLLIHGLANRNVYEISIGAVLALFLGILLGIGYAVRRKSEPLTPSWQIPTPVTATEISISSASFSTFTTSQNTSTFDKPHPTTIPKDPFSGAPHGNLHRIHGIPNVPLFFRVHFEVRGNLTLGNRGVLFYSVDWSSHAETGDEIIGSLFFPFGGQFQGMGCRTLRDIFGMVRFRIPPILHRSFAVLPAPSKKLVQLRLDPSLGIEEKRTLRSADEERYFMREYAPGDRFRDINWKTSSRLAFLVTRIAPQAQEKTRIIPVAFRCFGPSRPDLLALWTLDRCKAWLFQFLWTIRREHPEFILRVITPLMEEELTTDQEAERFCEEITGYTYYPLGEEGKFSSLATTPEEVFAFSTTYDGGLTRFVGTRFDHPTHLYVISPVRRVIYPSYEGRRDLSSSLPSPTRLRVGECLRQGGVLFPPLLRPAPVPSISPPRPLKGTLEIERVGVSL